MAQRVIDRIDYHKQQAKMHMHEPKVFKYHWRHVQQLTEALGRKW